MNRRTLWFPGQRCVSTTEAELGLGTVIAADSRFVEVAFRGAGCARKYAAASAPLKRAVFGAGDCIQDLHGKRFRITGVSGDASAGLITYQCDDRAIPENQISQSCAASTPLRRLAAGGADRSGEFALRARLLAAQSEILRSPCRGFIGGRIELLPHQLSIAAEVASRRIVRAVLADEIGLGKTIEACLILHRLVLTGRVRRCLICVPETLVHQWFVELLRRFNLMFRLFTQEHFDSCGADGNPFLNDQFGICSLRLLSGDSALRDRAAEAKWDLVIVDEAHHVRHGTAEYACVQMLSKSSAGLILLTATPEQLGRYDHFLRLQLLDPHRYADFAEYEAQTQAFVELSKYIASSSADTPGKQKVRDLDTTIMDTPVDLPPRLPDGKAEPARSMTLRQIIDRFGTGRVMFRTTRHHVSGFPRRMVHIAPLDAISAADGDSGTPLRRTNPLTSDPRTAWLAGVLKASPREKFLVICMTKDCACHLHEALTSSITVNAALFHEGMTLLQRDRNAAWFADEEGARVMLCSEIGSEGRNFQFCRNLVLFDLPADPELLEQRIGRIDRIGQGTLIHIHVPYVRATAQEALCRWYHEGLDAFRHNVAAAGRVGELVRGELTALLADSQASAGGIDACVRKTAALCIELSRQLADGRDFLLQRSSFRPIEAKRLKQTLEQTENGKLAETIMTHLFKQYGICVEEAGAERWLLNPDYLTDNRFPAPRQERPLITYSRKAALSREDIEFITIDHPMVLGALDLFLSSDSGTSAFAVWDDPCAKQLLLEAHYVLECLAPETLFAHRFLPPILLRVVVDHTGNDVTDSLRPPEYEPLLTNGPIDRLLAKRRIVDRVLPAMLASCDNLAHAKSAPAIDAALTAMRTLLDEEILRLKDLRQVNPMVSDEEIAACEREKEALETHLAASRIRLDSIRVIWRGKAG